MATRGSALLVMGIVIGVLVALILGAGIYFYKFYTFKTIRLCIGEPQDTKIPCSSNSECVGLVIDKLRPDINLSDAPEFVRGEFQGIVNQAVYCDGSCRIKEVRGINKESGELEFLNSCNADETEVLIDIRGKEAFEIWNYLKTKKT